MTISLVTQLRSKLRDDRAGRAAIRLACVDEAASECLLAITAAKRLTTTPIGARKASALDVDLLDVRYDTVRLLFEYLSARPGYRATLEPGCSVDHPSSDLEAVGTLTCLDEGASLRHHVFADVELHKLCNDAARRHNLSYTVEIVPVAEEPLVLHLAYAEACRMMAADAAKRRGLDLAVADLLRLADSAESAYRSDTRRQAHAVPVATAIDAATVGQGDVFVGRIHKRSLRTGRIAPRSAASLPAKPILDEPTSADIEDTSVTLSWTRDHSEGFYSYELWRDVVPDVQRRGATSNGPAFRREIADRTATAVRVFCSTEHPTMGVFTTENITPTGQSVVRVTDNLAAAPIEPETTYYYRLWVTSNVGDYIASDAVAVTTKAMRARLASEVTDALSPATGPAGTSCTITGSRFDANTRVTLGGKAVANLALVSSTEMTFDVPTFANAATIGLSLDLVVTSGNGLRDVLAQAFRLTAS